MNATRAPLTLLYVLPPLLVAALTATYHFFPSFYLHAVLSFEKRELQAVEIVTFVCALGASILLGWSGLRLWKARRREPVGGGAVIVGVVAAASFFFAGEEISWGQEYFGWETPESIYEHTPRTNLHNLKVFPVRVQTLASLFLVAMFFVLPAAWRLDRPARRLPPQWRPAIAEGPVVFCMAVAFLWRESKVVYRWFNAAWETDPDAHPWYWEFFEQVPEQKEMLVAVALLTYGAFRLRVALRAT